MSDHLVESLETRRLCEAVLRQDALHVLGTSAGDRVIVARVGKGLPRIAVVLNGKLQTFAPDLVFRVIIDGGDGDDRILVKEPHRALSLPLRVLGNRGDDTIVGSSGDDTLDGGDGHDRISGRDGDDVILGGAGDDRINGQRGHDRLFGGQGDDRLIGALGKDLLDGRGEVL